MKVIKTGEHKADALNTLIEVEKPIERASRITLRRLACLMRHIQALGSESLAAYAEKLSKHYQGLTKTDSVTLKSIDMAELVAQHDILAKYQDLAKHILNFHLQLVELPQEGDWCNGRFQIPNKRFLRSVLVPEYYNLHILIETIGANNAFKLHKKFTTQYKMAQQTADNEFESVEALMEDRLKKTAEPSEWVMLHTIVDDGKYAYRNENCTWIEALTDLPDANIKYHVCCYGDFQGAKLWNDHFVLTMEHTIAQGDPYCSRLLHDTRLDWDLKHLTKVFWDNMGSE